jgi:hypothetical protein
MELEESFLVLAISTGAFAQDHAAHLEEILYRPLWNLLPGATRDKVLKQNYERIFNDARHKVRKWESTHRPPQRTYTPALR